MLQSVCTTNESQKSPEPCSQNDEETERHILRQLRQSGVGGQPAVQCQFRNGVLVLSGSLPSYYRKQMAQEVALQAAHVSRVVNLIEVVPSKQNQTK